MRDIDMMGKGGVLIKMTSKCPTIIKINKITNKGTGRR